LLKVRVDVEHALLGEGHGILDWAMIGKLAEIGNQERGHVARRRIDLARAGPFENSLLLTRPADCPAYRAVTLHGAGKQVAWQWQGSNSFFGEFLHRHITPLRD
jgi:hypothetical protein